MSEREREKERERKRERESERLIHKKTRMVARRKPAHVVENKCE